MLKLASVLLAIVSLSSLAAGDTDFDALLQQAKLNNPRAQYQVAKAYQQGDGVTASNSESLYWLEEAASNRYKQAQKDLISYYRQDPKQTDKAMYWLTRLAINGDDQAQYELGLMYEKQGYPLDNLSQSKIWYQLASKTNNKAEQAYNRILESEFNAQRAKQVAAINELDLQFNQSQSIDPTTRFTSRIASTFNALSYVLLALVFCLAGLLIWQWRHKRAFSKQWASDADTQSNHNSKLKLQVKQHEATIKQQKRQIEVMFNQLKAQKLELSAAQTANSTKKPASTSNFSLACALFGFDDKKLPDDKQIKVRYKQLCKIYHPDLKGSDEEMKRLNSALKTILKNVNK